MRRGIRVAPLNIRKMELGQAVFGNPVGNYETERYQDALVLSLLDEIDRVFWNKNQKQWDRHEDPKLTGVVFRPYYWGDNEDEASLCNLCFDFSDQEIRWYKHPGRSMSVTLAWTPDEWVKWYSNALNLIESHDTIE